MSGVAVEGQTHDRRDGRPGGHRQRGLESLADDVAITTITLAELLAGVHRLPNSRRRETLSTAVSTTVQTYRSSRTILAFDSSAAEHYAAILAARGDGGLDLPGVNEALRADLLTQQTTQKS